MDLLQDSIANLQTFNLRMTHTTCQADDSSGRSTGQSGPAIRKPWNPDHPYVEYPYTPWTAIYAYIDPPNHPNVGIYGSPMECMWNSYLHWGHQWGRWVRRYLCSMGDRYQPLVIYKPETTVTDLYRVI